MSNFYNDEILEKEFIKKYDPDKYKKPSVTVDMLIFTVETVKNNNLRKLPEKKLKLLMVKRSNHPYINHWALPGGFVNIDEDIDSAAKRELLEETGIDAEHEGIFMEQLYTWGQVDRDSRMRVISVSYISVFNSESLKLKPGDDAKEAEWFEVGSHNIKETRISLENGFLLEMEVELNLESSKESYHPRIMAVKESRGKSRKVKKEILDRDGVAFDHPIIIDYGLQKLRKKIEHTDLVFNLMPEYFTLTELQQVYEIIIGRKLLKANFRRKISGMVADTGVVKKENAHRPAKLYRFNPDWNRTVFD